jgi:hypothetical protein
MTAKVCGRFRDLSGRLYPAPRSNPAQRPPVTRSAPSPLLSATPARRSVPAHVDYWPAPISAPLPFHSHMLPQQAATPGQWHLKKTPHDACTERHMYRKPNDELRVLWINTYLLTRNICRNYRTLRYRTLRYGNYGNYAGNYGNLVLYVTVITARNYR